MSKYRIDPVQVVSLQNYFLDCLKNISKWPISTITTWSNSLVVLQWVSGPPSNNKWKTYMADWMNLIQRLIFPDHRCRLFFLLSCWSMLFGFLVLSGSLIFLRVDLAQKYRVNW